MSVRITTIHADPEAAVIPALYCRCGRAAVEGQEVMGVSRDYVCPAGCGWVGNIRTDEMP